MKNENPLLLSPFLPELVGQKDTDIVIGKHSGLPTVEYYLEKTNLVVDEEKKSGILDAIKERAYEKSGLLSTEDFINIVKNA